MWNEPLKQQAFCPIPLCAVRRRATKLQYDSMVNNIHRSLRCAAKIYLELEGEHTHAFGRGRKCGANTVCTLFCGLAAPKISQTRRRVWRTQVCGAVVMWWCVHGLNFTQCVFFNPVTAHWYNWAQCNMAGLSEINTFDSLGMRSLRFKTLALNFAVEERKNLWTRISY